MTWRGKRFGELLNYRRIYTLRNYLNMRKEQIYDKFFEEVNHHIKEHTERYYLRNNNYVVPPSLFDKVNLATLNEILTKQGLHQLDRLITNGGEYEKPWIFNDCANAECVRYIATHETDGTGGI